MNELHKKPSSITLIDDEPIDNFINERVIKLSEFDTEVKIFSSGMRALDYFRSVVTDDRSAKLPDYIFLDLYMPIIDGYQFLDALLSLSPACQNIKVVILTASVNPADKERSSKYSQIIAHHCKPLTSELLNELLNGKS